MVGVKTQKGDMIYQNRWVYVELDDVLLEVSQRRDYALLFATDVYDEWEDLSNPVYDATAIEKELREKYGFETELVLNET